MPHDRKNPVKPSVQSPVVIRVDDRDNVAVIVNEGGLPSGATLRDGTVLLESIPPGQKVALADLGEGAPVIRYGEVIGRALRAIPRGSRVDESILSLPEAPALDDLPL